VYRDASASTRTAHSSFQKSEAGNFCLEDRERSGRRIMTDTDLIKIAIDENPRFSMRDIGQHLNLPQITVHHHLVRLEYKNRYEVWVSHILVERKMLNRVSAEVLAFDWDVFLHPTYSPDLAASGYYLLLSLKNSLRHKTFASLYDIKKLLRKVFCQQS